MAEGRIYADGLEVFVDTVQTGPGTFSLGGPIAYCDNPKQAQIIAKRLDAFKPLLAACEAAEELAQIGILNAAPELLQKVDRLRKAAIAAARGEAARA